MKAVIQDMKTGKMHVGEVPPPAVQSRGILVRVRRSLISLGTERAIVGSWVMFACSGVSETYPLRIARWSPSASSAGVMSAPAIQ